MVHYVVDALWQQARGLVSQGIKTNTQKTYSCAQKNHFNFCERMGLNPCPTSEQALLMYVTELHNRGLKHSTIQVYLAAVRSWHIQEGFGNPLDGCLRLQYAMKAIKQGSPPPRQKLPVTHSILLRIYSQLFPSADYDIAMLWSAFTLAYYGLFRAAEITVTGKKFIPAINLQLKDVKMFHSNSQSYLTLNLKRSKTDTANRGTTIYIGCSQNHVCAVCAMKYYFQLRADCDPSQPLYIFTSGQILTRELLAKNLKSFLAKVGIDPTHYSGHSFRAGGATDAALSCLADWELKLAGRWSSEAYQRYIRAPPSVLLSFAHRMIQPTPKFHQAFPSNIFL